jgi:cobalamin adenosyltransferase
VSASLELARTIVRRAERRVVALRRRGFAGEWTLPYLNRLADLLWVLARAAEQAESRPARSATTPARAATTGARGRRGRAHAGAPDPAGGVTSEQPGSPSA